MPFNQFSTWQLAGDLMPSHTKEQTLATAFLRVGKRTTENGAHRRGIPRRVRRRSRQHRRHRLSRHDRGLRAVPRSQIRPDQPEGLLLADRVLQQHRRARLLRARAAPASRRVRRCAGPTRRPTPGWPQADAGSVSRNARSSRRARPPLAMPRRASTRSSRRRPISRPRFNDRWHGDWSPIIRSSRRRRSPMTSCRSRSLGIAVPRRRRLLRRPAPAIRPPLGPRLPTRPHPKGRRLRRWRPADQPAAKPAADPRAAPADKVAPGAMPQRHR